MSIPEGEQHPEDFGVGRLFALTSEAIIAVDLVTERIVLWNPAAATLLGYTAEEAVGMRLDRLVPDSWHDRHAAGFRRYQQGGEPVLIGAGPVVVPAVTKTGDALDVALSLTDVSEGQRRVVLAILRDVTAQLQAERALAAANDSMREFVAHASHDLRTPLASVLGFSSLLVERGARLTEEQRQSSLEAILRAAQGARRLVDDLLTHSGIQAGAVIARPGRVQVGDLVSEVAARLDVAVLRVDGDRHLEVFADPDHVRRMLDNYLANAARYGQPPITVTFTTHDSLGEIRVCDAGAGVPESFVSRLFTSFARPDDTAHKDSTGLGLSIVKGLAEANGGRSFYERVEATTCFGVALPLAEPDT